MNAMAEARMVAARIQRPLDFEHGAVAGRDRITFSSQGSRKTAHIIEAYQKRVKKLRAEVRTALAFDWHC
jgi:hypothetical protein